MNKPRLASTTGFFNFFPLKAFFPLGNEKYTPEHDEQSIEEIGWTIISSVFIGHVKENSNQSNNHWKQKPLLQETNKIKITLGIWTNPLLNIIKDDGPIVRYFLDGNKFKKANMGHDLKEGKIRLILLFFISLSRSVEFFIGE